MIFRQPSTYHSFPYGNWENFWFTFKQNNFLESWEM